MQKVVAAFRQSPLVMIETMLRMENIAVDSSALLTMLNSWDFCGYSEDVRTTALRMLSGIDYVSRHAPEVLTWDFIIEVNRQSTYDCIRPGSKFRTGLIHIPGTHFTPVVPVEEDILAYDPNGANIGELMASILYNQLFWDGNERTAFLVASVVAIQRGDGVLWLHPQPIIDKYHVLLNNMFEYGETAEFIAFINSNVIQLR